MPALDPGGAFEPIQFQREVARALPLVEHIWHTSPLPVTLPESSSALPRSTWHMGEYEYEPLDELIATPPFTRCACYFRYTYGCLAGWRCHAILHVSPSQIRPSVVPPKSTFRAFGLHVYFVRLYSAEIDFTFILRRVLPPLMGPLRPTRGPKAPRNGGRGVRVS